VLSAALDMLAATLAKRPDLALPISVRIQECADMLREQEQQAIPPHLAIPETLPPGVVRLAEWRARA
jgi:hypothetical protein